MGRGYSSIISHYPGSRVSGRHKNETLISDRRAPVQYGSVQGLFNRILKTGETRSVPVGTLLMVVGTVLLAACFVVANDFLMRSIPIDDTLAVKMVFLSAMVAIGSFIYGKGVDLGEETGKAGFFLIPLSCGMLLYSFYRFSTDLLVSLFPEISAETFLHILVNLIFLTGMVWIGGYILSRGVEHVPHRIKTGGILTGIGIALLMACMYIAYILTTVTGIRYGTSAAMVFPFMALIGGIITHEGTQLSRGQKLVGYLLLVGGIAILLFSFVSAYQEVIATFVLNDLYLNRMLFYAYMVVIGMYLMGAGIGGIGTAVPSPE